MGNLFYEQLQKMSEESNNYEILKKLYERVNNERIRVSKLFKEEFEKKGDYSFYYGMFLAYSNITTMIIVLNNEKGDN